MNRTNIVGLAGAFLAGLIVGLSNLAVAQQERPQTLGDLSCVDGQIPIFGGGPNGRFDCRNVPAPPDNAIESRHLAAGAVTAGKIAQGAVQRGNIGTGAVERGNLAMGAVAPGNIADAAVQAGDVETDAITAMEIAQEAVTGDELMRGAIGPRHIGDEAIGLRHLERPIRRAICSVNTNPPVPGC